VRLSFDIASFGIYDYLSLLYVAFHECFVHGYCGVQIVGGESGLSKPFHEGWMDCVAVLVLEQRLTRLISISTHHVEAYPDEFMKQARVVCDRRYNPVNKARLADVVDWNYGASALRTLQWLMAWHFIEQGVGDSVAVGSAVASELVRFSAVINASNLSHARRAEFVNIVVSRYSYNNNAGRTDAISRRPEIIDALDAYFRTKNCLAFVEEVVAIPGS